VNPLSTAPYALHDWPLAMGVFSLSVRIPQSKKNRRPVHEVRVGDSRARCDAAEEGLTQHPQRVAVKNPQGSLRFHLKSHIESATWLIHDSKWKRLFTRRLLSLEFCKHADSKGVSRERVKRPV